MNLLTKAKWMLWLFGHFKVPMIAYTRPKIIEMSEEHLVVKIPFRRRTKNHLNSMYFGALAVGADVSGGLLAVYFAQKSHLKISLVFKSFHADFIKRPQKDVYFVCHEGKRIQDMLARSSASKARVNEMLKIEAFVDYDTHPEKVVDFGLELSLKVLD